MLMYRNGYNGAVLKTDVSASNWREGSNPSMSVSPDRFRIAGSTSGHCPAKLKMIWVLAGVQFLNIGRWPI